MARHSSGQNNYRLSTPLIIALGVIVAILAVIAWWVFSNSSDDSDDQAVGTTESTTTAASSEGECIEGELTLPIGGDPTVLQAAVDDYNATNPVTRDHCVTAEAVADGEPAATYLFAGTRDDAAAALARTDAVAASSPDAWQQAGSITAGTASADGASTDLDAVSFPVASAPSLSAIVARALADDDEAAAAALADDLETTTADASGAQAFAALESTELPDGYTFDAADGAELPVWAIAVNAGGDITEDQARAGADFITATSSDAQETSVDVTALLERATAISEENNAVVVEQGQPSDTLIVLDTSNNMDRVVDGTQESYHTMTSRILADLARDTGGQGNQVALNNYSSPLNPGVTRGWRPNVSFPDGSDGNNAANAIARFGTGGVPLTRAAAVAAASIASEHAGNTGREVRVVLVTSGSASDYNDDAFLADIRAAGGDRVSFHLIHVGSEPVDQVLTNYVTSTGGTAVTATTPQQVDASLRSGFGF